MSHSSPLLSIVIGLFNNLRKSQTMLFSLINSIRGTFSYEIILVDDCSEDNTKAWMQSISSDKIITIYNSHNLGYAKTNNRGVEACNGEIICLLNNDTELPVGWLEPLLKLLYTPKLNAGIVGNIHLSLHDGSIDHAGITLSPFGKFEHIRTISSSHSEYCNVIASTGACTMFRKVDFISTGGFDEHYINGCEDVDLCYKFRNFGKNIIISNTSKIYHHIRSSRQKIASRDESNSRYLYKKWRSEIKQDLNNIYSNLITDANNNCNNILKNSILSPILPVSIASDLCAETTLKKEEHRWTNLIDKVDNNSNIHDHCMTIYRLHHYAGTYSIHFSRNIIYIRNFYVCGYCTNLKVCDRVTVSIVVNDHQSITSISQDDSNFNVGLTDPLFHKNTNSITVTLVAIDKHGFPLPQPNLYYTITHFIIDDKLIETHVLLPETQSDCHNF